MAREMHRQEADEVKNEIHELINSYDKVFQPRKNSCGIIQPINVEDYESLSPHAGTTKKTEVVQTAEQQKSSPKASKKKKKGKFWNKKDKQKDEDKEEDLEDLEPEKTKPRSKSKRRGSKMQ